MFQVSATLLSSNTLSQDGCDQEQDAESGPGHDRGHHPGQDLRGRDEEDQRDCRQVRGTGEARLDL